MSQDTTSPYGSDTNPAGVMDQPAPSTERPSPGGGKSSGGKFLALVLAVIAAIGGGLYYWTQGDLTSLWSNEVHVSGSLTSDTHWRADKRYHLDDLVFVEGNARLTIEAGTQIFGGPGSALIVTQESTIEAKGTADRPIVMTSAQPVGSRARGDWGGVVLLGLAPVNNKKAFIEGLHGDPRGLFGGSDAASNCGVMEYVRIEFAGYEAFPDNELNGLTLGGCGHATVLSHIQVHRSLDDGIEMFGGSANLKHVAITGAGDDSLDWDIGWNGKVQFLMVQQFPDMGDNAFEGDNNDKSHDALPRSMPTIYNATLIAPWQTEKKRRAMTIRRGSGGTFSNILIGGFAKELIDLRDLATVALIEQGDLTFSHLHVLAQETQASQYLTEQKEDDGGFDEVAYFMAPERQVQWSPFQPKTYEQLKHQFFQANGLSQSAAAAALPSGDFWSKDANFVGAVPPGAAKTWLTGWTAFPTN